MSSCTFRVRIDFSSLSTAACGHKTAWYLLNPTVCDTVQQLKRRVCEWFEIEVVSTDFIEIWLDNYPVPDKESVLIFKPNDLLVLRTKSGVVNDQTESEANHDVSNETKRQPKTSKKHKRKDSKLTNGHEVENTIDSESTKETEENEVVTSQKRKRKKKKYETTNEDDKEDDHKVKRKKKRHQDFAVTNETEQPRSKRSKSVDLCRDEVSKKDEENGKDRRKKKKKRRKDAESEKIEAEKPCNEESAKIDDVNGKEEEHRRKQPSSSTRRKRRKLINTNKPSSLTNDSIETNVTNDEEPRLRRNPSFVSTNDYRSSLNQHIRFDRDDGEQGVIPNDGTVVTNRDRPSEENVIRPSDRDGLEHGSPRSTESIRLARLAERDVLTNTSTVLKNPIEDQAPSIPKDYLQYPVLEGPPRVNDIVAYKTLELSEIYTPEVSDFKVAKVLEYDSEGREVLLELQEPVSIGNRRGKFELTSSNEDEEDRDTEETLVYEVTLEMSSFVDIRLVTNQKIV